MANRNIHAGDTGILIKYDDFMGENFKKIIAHQEVVAMKDSPIHDDLVKVQFTDPGVIQRLAATSYRNATGWHWFKTRIKWGR
jgi:hypothetical protein